MSYNVFVDASGHQVAVFNQPRAYDASAIANHFVDEGFEVCTDLWGETVPDAMLSPQMYEIVTRDFPAVTN